MIVGEPETETATDATPTESTASLAAVILAAGKGTRMKSRLPKVLHEIAGLPMLGHVLALTADLSAQTVAVVVGHEAEQVESAATRMAPGCRTVRQEPQLGTGHAVQVAVPAIGAAHDDVIMLYGDTPHVQQKTIERMRAERRRGAGVVVLGFETPNPGRYGRLVTDADGALDAIVEAKDATEEQLAITLCNGGVMCFDGAKLGRWLSHLSNENAAGEYYVTDVIAIARAEGVPCAVVRSTEDELQGINTRVELAQAEASFQTRRREAMMLSGVTLRAPETVFFSADTQVESDVIVEPNVVFGPGVHVESGAEIRAFSHLEACTVRAGAQVGPYARLRPGTEVGRGARVGNFVELKNTSLGESAKVNHLSYIGDAEIGRDTNVGAGTITCNYDGYAKHRTVVGDDVFIGSNSALVAPVSVGDRATVAAGSTITKDVGADALAFGRSKQSVKKAGAIGLRNRLQKAKKNPKAD